MSILGIHTIPPATCWVPPFLFYHDGNILKRRVMASKRTPDPSKNGLACPQKFQEAPEMWRVGGENNPAG
jgi:hypothetical protein